MSNARKQRLAVLAAGLGVVLLAGCGAKTFWVEHYPAFYAEDLKTVAVAPFENATREIGVGGEFAAHLADALARNGTYKIITPADLKALVGEKALEAGDPQARQALLDKLKAKGDVQALITGTVRACSATASSWVEWDRVHGYASVSSFYGHRHRGFGWGWGWQYDVPLYGFSSQAYVAVEASLVRVSDGAALAATEAPVRAVVRAEGHAPPEPGHLMMEAAERAVARLVEELAVVPVKVKAKPHDDLKTARGKTGAVWDFDRDFAPRDEKMFVVLRLPSAARRNPFRLTVIPEDREDEVLAEKAFTWSPELAAQGFEFSPKALAAARGPGDYQVNLYSGAKRLMKREFEVKE